MSGSPARRLVPGRLAIVGAGDHGRVVMELARAAGITAITLVEPRGDEPGARRVVAGVRIAGDLRADTAWADGRPHFVVALGDNEARRAAFERCLALGLEPLALAHPSAVILDGAVLEPGAVVCAAAVVGVDARVGRNSIVNTAATIDHDGWIGEHVQIAPGAHLGGRVVVGARAYVGIGAAVREGLSIGDGALVAGGEMVVRDVPDGARVAGVPAREMRESVVG